MFFTFNWHFFIDLIGGSKNWIVKTQIKTQFHAKKTNKQYVEISTGHFILCMRMFFILSSSF